jgi:hypothetical protein
MPNLFAQKGQFFVFVSQSQNLYSFSLISGTMNTIARFAVLVISAGLVIGTTSMTNQVFADKSNAQDGLNRADENVHENAPQNDVTFHEGLCQGGHSTDVLDEITDGEGCDANPPITDPGNSDDNRQDDDD